MFQLKSLVFAFFSLAQIGLSQAAIVSHQWTLANKVISPDGANRSAALINGQYPGPLLKFNKGDTGLIAVNNRLTDPTMRRSTSIVGFSKNSYSWTRNLTAGLYSIGMALYVVL